MSDTQTLIRNTHHFKTSTKTKIPASISILVPDKSDSKVLKYHRDNYLEARPIKAIKVIWK